MKTNSTLFVDYLCIPAELVFCYWFSKHSPLDPNLQKYQISHKFTAFVCLKLILPFSILLLGFQTKNIVLPNNYDTIWIWSKCRLVVCIYWYCSKENFVKSTKNDWTGVQNNGLKFLVETGGKYFVLGFNFLPQWDFNFLPHKGGFALALCHWDFNFLPHKGGFEWFPSSQKGVFSKKRPILRLFQSKNLPHKLGADIQWVTKSDNSKINCQSLISFLTGTSDRLRWP